MVFNPIGLLRGVYFPSLAAQRRPKQGAWAWQLLALVGKAIERSRILGVSKLCTLHPLFWDYTRKRPRRGPTFVEKSWPPTRPRRGLTFVNSMAMVVHTLDLSEVRWGHGGFSINVGPLRGLPWGLRNWGWACPMMPLWAIGVFTIRVLTIDNYGWVSTFPAHHRHSHSACTGSPCGRSEADTLKAKHFLRLLGHRNRKAH